MTIDISASVHLAFVDNIYKLEEFIAEAREHGLEKITWSAYEGNIREPSVLTLKATKNG